MSRYASLTAGLLARKGEAEPAATPFADQILTRVGATGIEHGLTPMFARAEPPPSGDSVAAPFSFGRRPGAPHLPPPPAPELSPAVVVLREVGSQDNCAACPGPVPEAGAKTYHVNLRLKRRRFVKLKLSAALLRRPVQDIVAEALDQWFEKLPGEVLGDCACLRGGGD